jgi:multiple sugar transport system ATP-binding protein
VQHVEYFGSHWVAEVATDVGPVRLLVDKAARPRAGEAVGLAFDPRRLVLFDAASEQLLPSALTRTHTRSMHCD